MTELQSKLLISGCGYVGKALSQAATSCGWKVWGLRRDSKSEETIVQAGAQPIWADLTQPKKLKNLPDTDFIVCSQAPNSKGDSYRKTYVEGTKNLIQVYKDRPPKKFIWISSTSVFGQFNGEWVDEDTIPRPQSDNAKILLEAEHFVLQSKMPSIVLRLGGIYGPDRHVLNRLKEYPMLAQSNTYVNQIHLVDIVGIIQLLLTSGKIGEIYLGVDDEPMLKSKFYSWIAEQIGLPPTPNDVIAPAHAGNRRCSNKKIKALGYQFRYPNGWQGYQEILDEALTLDISTN